MPDPKRVREMPALRLFGTFLHDPNLFHMNRHSVAGAFFVGIFVAFLPIPGQMFIAPLAAIIFHCNLPITVALIFISNPVTIAPIFFATYKLGTWILSSPIEPFEPEISWQWLRHELGHIWLPLLVGSLLTGLVLASIGYLATLSLWRWHVVRNWNKRRLRRQNDTESE